MKFILIFFSSFMSVMAQERKLAITIDDLPATSNSSQYEYITDNILETLTKNKIPAIGFVNEQKLYNEGVIDSMKVKTLEKWLKKGMELGNHTFSHIYINNATLDEYKKDVLKGEIVTRSLMKKYDKELKYFRHTQLRTGPTEEYRIGLNQFLQEHNYTIAPVTIDNDEYIYAYCYDIAKKKKDDAMMKKIGEDYIKYMQTIFEYYEKLSFGYLGYEPNQILLIHANTLNADYLNKLVKMLEKRGYDFISVGDALKDKAYLKPEGTHSRGLSWIQRWMITDNLEVSSQPEVSDFISKHFNANR